MVKKKKKKTPPNEFILRYKLCIWAKGMGREIVIKLEEHLFVNHEKKNFYSVYSAPMGFFPNGGPCQSAEKIATGRS